MTGHENGAVYLHELSPLEDLNQGPPACKISPYLFYFVSK